MEITFWRGHRRGEAATLSNIAGIDAWFSRRDKADAHHCRALAIELGQNLILAGRLNNAAGAVGEALTAAAELANRLIEADVSIALAKLARRVGDVRRATAHVQRAVAGESSCLPLAASTLQQAGRAAAAAEEKLGEALALARLAGWRRTNAGALFHLAEIARSRDLLYVARERIEDSLTLIEDRRRTVLADELRASFVAERPCIVEDSVDLLMELHRREPGAGGAERLLDDADAGRVWGLLDLLDRAGVDLAADARHRVNALELRRRQLAARGQEGEVLAAFEAEADAQRRQAACLLVQALAASRRAGELIAAPPPRHERVRARFGADELLLEVARWEPEELARNAYAALSAPDSDSTGDRASAELRRLLDRVTAELTERFYADVLRYGLPIVASAPWQAPLAAAEAGGNLFRLAVISCGRRRLDNPRDPIEERLRRTMRVDERRVRFIDLLMELHWSEPGAGWAQRATAAAETGWACSLLDVLDCGRVDRAAGALPEPVTPGTAARHRSRIRSRKRSQYRIRNLDTVVKFGGRPRHRRVYLQSAQRRE